MYSTLISCLQHDVVMDGDDNDNGDGRMEDNDNDDNGKDGKGNGAMDDNGCLDDQGLDARRHHQPAAACWQEEVRLQHNKHRGGGDGCRFGGDTHNNQTDHREGGW